MMFVHVILGCFPTMTTKSSYVCALRSHVERTLLAVSVDESASIEMPTKISVIAEDTIYVLG